MNEVLSHYGEIMTDPAHLMAEISLMLIVDVLFLGMVWPLLKRMARREHTKIDAEHGVIDHGRKPVSKAVKPGTAPEIATETIRSKA